MMPYVKIDEVQTLIDQMKSKPVRSSENFHIPTEKKNPPPFAPAKKLQSCATMKNMFPLTHNSNSMLLICVWYLQR